MLQNISDIYRFTVTFPNHGDVEVTPVNGTIEFEWELVEDTFVYRKKLKTRLLFTNDNSRGITDFDKFYGHDRSSNKCEILPITIEKNCDDVWTTWHEGEIWSVDGQYDVSSCQVSFSVRPNDQWTCIDKHLKEEQNVLDIKENETVDITIGDYEYITLECGDLHPCSGDYRVPLTTGLVTLPPGGGPPQVMTINPGTEQWTVFYHFGLNLSSDFRKKTTYVREYIIQATSPGSDWTQVDTNKWVRPASVRFVSEEDNGTEYELIYELTFGIGSVDNGRYLSDVFDFLFSDCDITVVSDFYNHNPDNTHPDNHPYQIAEDSFQEIVVYQKTDWKDPDASNFATILQLSIEDLFTHLRYVHNVYPGFDENGNFRLEHITYWSRNLMMDLTADDVKHFIRGRYQYKYDKNDLPRKETWTFMDKTTEAFDGVPITYSECFTDRENDEKKYPMDYLTTNVEYIANSPDNINNDGMVWVATNNGVMITEPNALTNQYVFNAPFALPNLLYNFHRWHRPQKMGEMNYDDEIFFSVIPTRVQGGIELPICCADQDSFNPSDKIKTQLGWGEVSKATLKHPGGKLTLELRHVS